MSGLEGENHLPDKVRGPEWFERTLPDDQLAQTHTARDVLHLDEVESAIAAQVVNRHNMRMKQVGHRARLVPEPLSDSRLLRDEARIHDLQGARPVQFQMMGPVNP